MPFLYCLTLFLSLAPPVCLESQFFILVIILQNRTKKLTKMKKKQSSKVRAASKRKNLYKNARNFLEYVFMNYHALLTSPVTNLAKQRHGWNELSSGGRQNLTKRLLWLKSEKF